MQNITTTKYKFAQPKKTKKAQRDSNRQWYELLLLPFLPAMLSSLSRLIYSNLQ